MTSKRLIEFDVSNKFIIGYNCPNCNGYNDYLSYPCVYCHSFNSPFSSSQRGLVRYKRNPDGNEISTMTQDEDRIELYTKWFNRSAVLVSEMDAVQLESFIKENELIIVEAKANVNAGKESKRTREAKLNPKNREWLSGTNELDAAISDSLKQRRPRTSKMDKLAETYRSLGIELPDDIRSKIVKKQTEDSFQSSHHVSLNLKPIRSAGMTFEDSGIDKRSDLDKAIEKAKNESLVPKKGIDFNALSSILKRKHS